MAEQTDLEVTTRTTLGKANKHLRKEGLIPGNIFGHGQESQAIQLDAVRFDYLRRHGALRNILTLHLPDKSTQTVLLRHVQREPKTGHILHVDFSRVSLTERINMRIPLRYVGEAPAVKNEGGVLLHLVDALEVECSASDIVDALDVDISSLAEIDAALHASDVKLPTNFKLVTNPDEPIAKVAATRGEPAAEETTTAPAASPTPAAEE